MNMKIKKDTFFLILPIFLIAIVAKIYEYCFMEENAFILINYVLNGINNGVMTGYNSIDFPIKVLSVFKSLNLNSPVSSGIFCAIFANIFCFIYFVKNSKTYSFKEYIFIYLSMFILNFTVFDFNKDIIQFIIINIIFFILISNKIKDITKIFIVSLILLLEVIFFRTYYIIIMGLFPISYLILKLTTSKENGKSKRKRKIMLKIIFLFGIFFTIVYVMQYISPTSYDQLINRREVLENIDAATIIKNIIPGYNFSVFCINYFINFIRCLFPIELLIKGLKYIIFAIYQIFLTCNVLKSFSNIEKKDFTIIAFIIAYCATLAASESDFGTYVRHQSVLIFFYLYIISNNIKRSIKINEKN